MFYITTIKEILMRNKLRATIWSIVLILTIISCSSVQTTHPYVEGVDEDLKPMVEEVFELMNLPNDSITSINFYYERPSFHSNKSYTIGYCSFSFKSMRHYVMINKYFWNFAPDRRKTLLLAHEIRHCVCTSGTTWMHKNEVREDGCPVHYMHPIIPDDWCISAHYSEYMKQIKKGCN